MINSKRTECSVRDRACCNSACCNSICLKLVVHSWQIKTCRNITCSLFQKPIQVEPERAAVLEQERKWIGTLMTSTDVQNRFSFRRKANTAHSHSTLRTQTHTDTICSWTCQLITGSILNFKDTIFTLIRCKITTAITASDRHEGMHCPILVLID